MTFKCIVMLIFVREVKQRYATQAMCLIASDPNTYYLPQT